jgi:hypothetical protein
MKQWLGALFRNKVFQASFAVSTTIKVVLAILVALYGTEILAALPIPVALAH